MKLMRLVAETKQYLEVAREGEEPFKVAFRLQANRQVEVIHESDGLFRVKARIKTGRLTTEDLTFSLKPEELYVPKGVAVMVYRPACGIDGTLRGITHTYADVILCGEGLGGDFAENENMPALRLWTRNIMGQDYTVAVPYEPGNYAFGGNFVYSDHQATRHACPPYGILPVHDHDLDKERR
jgi:hypothetical protein